MFETFVRIAKAIAENENFEGHVQIDRDHKGELNIWFTHFNNYYPHNNKFINYYERYDDMKMLADFEETVLDCIKNGTILEG